MGMGPIIWACLALTAHQSSVPEFFINSHSFEIGIKIDPKKRDQLKKVILLFSDDGGGNWREADCKLATEKAFIFRAPKDGRYLFIIQQVDSTDRAIPADPSRANPNQIVIVDTVRPHVKLTADRLPSGEIRVHWAVTDQYTDARSLRLEYHTSALPEGQWAPCPLPASPSLEGEQVLPPREALSGAVRIRVRVKDQAENVGEAEAAVPAAAATAASAPARPDISLIPTTTRIEQPAQLNQLTSQQTSRPALAAPPGPTGPAPPSGLPIPANIERMPAPTGNPAETPANCPALRIIKTREVRLDFTVNKVGPSGLGNAADVYVTLDRGKTWTKMQKEAPVSLAPNASLRGSESVSGSVSVQLPAEATAYGFIVSAKSGGGLAPPPPKANDPPEVLVELDTSAPQGRLFGPQPDPRQPSTLLLGWEAKDRNLAETPITLEWAKDKEGPWNPIGDGPLPNSGQYAWNLPNNLPPLVYLRLTMRDLAGNESRAQTDKPVLIDLSVPQTKITGVAPGSR